jgi:hypothetical protein
MRLSWARGSITVVDPLMKRISAALGRWLPLVAVFSGLLACIPVCQAQHSDAACLGPTTQLHYPSLNLPPIVEVRRTEGDAGAPIGAACFSPTRSAATWVTVASVVRSDDSQNALVRRFGAISELLTAQYWSTTDQKWRPLVSSAAAIPGANSTQPRGDFATTELATGSDHYYLVSDSRSGRPTAYQLRLRQSQPNRIVVETSNVDTVRQWGITLYAVNGLETLYFLEQRSPGVWAYYSITRILPASFLAQGHEKSYINRAVALFRHYMRLPTDAEPPAAP